MFIFCLCVLGRIERRVQDKRHREREKNKQINTNCLILSKIGNTNCKKSSNLVIDITITKVGDNVFRYEV